MKKILIAEPDNYPLEAKSLLAEKYLVEEEYVSYEKLVKKVPEYYGLLIRLDLPIDKCILSNSRELKFIATPSTGEDHIDTDLAETMGIKIISLKGERSFLESIYPTAEHTFALLLSLLRKLPFAFDDVKRRQWRREPFVGRELHRKTFGIIGLGRLGTMVCKYAQSFGMKVLACDVKEINTEEVKMVSLEELCRESDVISLHVNYTKENMNMINAKHFNLMKDDAIFINTARGQLVDEDALLDALQSKVGFCAALDVLSDENNKEYIKNSELIEYAKRNTNLIITPHIGGYTAESIKRTRYFITKKVMQL